MKRLNQFVRYIAGILIDHHVPVWMTIVAVIFSMLIANWWLPNLNARFENARIRSEYLLNNLRTLNADVGVLVREIGTFDRMLMGQVHPDLIAEKRELILRLIADLQWRSIEFDIVLSSKEGKAIVKRFSDNLNIVRREVEKAKNPSDIGGVLCSLRKFVPISHILLAKLAAEADVNLTILPEFEELQTPELSCDELLRQS